MALAQTGMQRARIVSAVDDSQTVKLAGNTHPLARAEFDRGAAPDSLAADRMLLLLSRSPEQQAALERLLQDQQTPGSPDFHKWLTPSDFARQFGPAASDLQQVTAWLQAQGFTVAHIGGGNTIIEFTGTAGQVRNAFHTQIHRYRVNNEDRWANATDPRIPSALAPVVSGVVSLNDFPRKPLSRTRSVFRRDPDGTVSPAVTIGSKTGNFYGLGPADFATIYNTNPLLAAGNNGTGQTIAILGRSNVHLQDVIDFRTMFGMSPGTTSVVIDGVDPGIVDGDETESLLDLEWSNAVAPSASIVLVSAQSTATTSGIDLAALHVIDNNMAAVMSVSYGGCEMQLGNTGNQFLQSTFAQAAAQGITVVVSSGDSGSDGCDDPNSDIVATAGLGVNGLASTPYNVAVGGTDFNDVSIQGNYFKSTNTSGTLASALSYVPERTWNESCGALASPGVLSSCPTVPATGTPDKSLNLWAGSGGPSSCTTSTISGSTITCKSGTPKPAWQSGPGVPQDGVRDIPDVSLFAAADSTSRSFYILCEADALPPGYQSCQLSSNGTYFLPIGGTSAAAPTFAAIVALAAQKAGTRLGNINYQLYPMASVAGNSCASTSATSTTGCIFNDVNNGNISVPCKAGTPNCSATSGTATGVLVDSSGNPAFAATSGYDLATGLGSVNAADLVAAIARNVNGFTPTTASLTLNGATAAVTAAHGAPISVGVALTPALAGSVALEGTNSAFDSNPLVAGSAVWNSTLFPGGSYTVKAHFPGDGQHGASDSNGVPVTITPEASQTFLDLITFDVNTGNLTSFNGNNVPYGSPYILRMSVADTAATETAVAGVSSKCSNKTASCPTGSVTVTANGQPLDLGSYKLNSLGVTEDLPIQLPAGNVALAASYSGDASYNANTATKSVTITKAPTSTSFTIPYPAPPYQYGSSAQILELVNTTSSGVAPTGTFTLTDNGVVSSLDNSGSGTSRAGGANGYATYSVASNYQPPSVGAHNLVVQYSGDNQYLPSISAALNITVAPATLYASCSTNPNFSTPAIPVTIHCTYVAYFSNPVQPTGTITIYDNGVALSGTVTTLDNAFNTARIEGDLTAYLFTQIGTHTITATYSGDSNYAPVTSSPLTVTVYDKIPPFAVVTASSNPTLTTLPITVNASFIAPDNRLTPPSGTVAFFDNGASINAANTCNSGNGSLYCSIPYTAPSLGTHVLTATYSGDATYAAATTTPYSLSVLDKFPSTLNIGYFGISAVVNEPAQFNAFLSNSEFPFGPPMTGTVTFYDGTTALPNPVIISNQFGQSYNAAYSYTFTTSGTHSISAQYSGDNNFAASQSSPSQITVVKQFVVNLPNSSYSTTVAGSSDVDFWIDNYSNSSIPVTITCTPDVSTAACSLNLSSVTSTPHSSTSVRATVTWPLNSAHSQPSRRPFGGMPFVFAGLLAGLAFTSRRKRVLAITLLLAGLTLAMASCGGGGGGGGSTFTPPPPAPVATKTYKFTITATSASASDSQVYTITETH